MTPLARTLRNGRTEAIHRGSIAVMNESGELLHSNGDPEFASYVRSSVKMVQAIPVIESGAADSYNLTSEEISVCCASHTGAEYHIAAVRSMLEKLGLSEGQLQCGGHLPEDREMRERLIRREATPTALYNNCSGKHTGMLAACLANDWDIDTYLDKEHPLQKRILELLAEYSGLPSDEIGIGTDGCSLPTYFMPLTHASRIASTFMHRARQSDSPDARLMKAMADAPEMVHSKEGFDSVVISAFGGSCYAKRGAMGIMLLGINSETQGSIGIGVKMESGSGGTIPCIVSRLLRESELAGEKEWSSLEPFVEMPSDNWNGIRVGETVPTDFPVRSLR